MHLMNGNPGWSYGEGSNDMADFLMNTKMIVLWGFEPTITHFGPGHQLAYYIKMAREKGIPVICIDPRYTVAAEVLADQWIPIKPGTDAAMMLAVANVLIKENLYDKKFVEKYVDPIGFEQWRSHIFGEKDGIDKTPEWAEKICAVPAETIRGFARLYAQTMTPASASSGRMTRLVAPLAARNAHARQLNAMDAPVERGFVFNSLAWGKT